MTVKELYEATIQQSNTKLLSSFTPGEALNDFWKEYRLNSDVFDRQFARTFANFEYFNPLSNSILTEWLIDVNSFLMKNQKRYSEMWRIQVIEDNDLPLTYNYDLHETYSGNTTNQGANTTGQRTDVNNTQIGSQNFGNVNKSTAFNSSAENTTDTSTNSTGSRNDVSQFTKGKETDTTQSQGTTSYTKTAKGNIGVQTGADILMKFNESMPVFDFYNKIFAEMCAELLQIGG